MAGSCDESHLWSRCSTRCSLGIQEPQCPNPSSAVGMLVADTITAEQRGELHTTPPLQRDCFRPPPPLPPWSGTPLGAFPPPPPPSLQAQRALEPWPRRWPPCASRSRSLGLKKPFLVLGETFVACTMKINRPAQKSKRGTGFWASQGKWAKAAQASLLGGLQWAAYV